ncbi:electron transport complex subunit RsxD [Methylotenera oryzisoli]|uniref:Ion-translocating oxidoreductase complex subunit D n=1 Tax=Methylotenera oryzisoli TaxID=2080758 RepID=A0A4Y9VNQ1_9PROT|nr:electron transport complex subunit RsxD [Methylotenera oryzisoli]TFW70344.1 electron transport complex subunit RsxD [Methylotenera oryzisoli]
MNRSPYITDAPSVSMIMLKVLLALVPGIIAYTWVYGGGILISLTLATITALITEAAILKIRQRPIAPSLADLSAVVTAWLLALALPPLAPWWLVVVGTLFAIAIAKQLYGGLGYNPFNPAMVGYAVLLISFPVIMTKWPAPLALATTPLAWTEQFRLIFGNILPTGVPLDAVTSATPLDYLKTQRMLQQEVTTISQASIFGHFGAKGGEWVTAAYLLGGLYLVQQRIISWHLPTAFIAALAFISFIFNIAQPSQFAGPGLHLMAGATMLGAFFIITDPVSGPTTPKGKLYFAAGAGVLTYLIRVYGGYPDGVAFAVLIMNMCVPLIDAHTQPRVFGHKR